MSDDIDTLARTLYGEARGESYIGRTAVANVVMNRVALSGSHPHFGDGTVAGACKAPYQFSCWLAADPNSQIINNVDDSDTVFADCLDIAKIACDGQLDDVTGGCTYYFATGTLTPTWAQGKLPAITIGRHEFYRNIA